METASAAPRQKRTPKPTRSGRPLNGLELEMAMKLRLRARQLNVTHADIARVVGVSKEAVYQALEGTYAMSLRTLALYAGALDMRLDVFLVPRGDK